MTGGAAAGGFRTERGVEYARPDGKPLQMTLYLPEDVGTDASGRHAGMVIVHGGGWRFGPRYQQAWYCRQFAKSGYVVMTIDYRMMPRYPFPHCVHDCKAAVRWLRAHADEWQVDADRIAAFGASAGGHLVAFLAATRPEHGFEGCENEGASSAVSAAISLYGAVDLTVYRDAPRGGFLSEKSRKYLRAFVGEDPPGGGLDAYEIASPITYVDEAAAPMLFVHGTRDGVVPYVMAAGFHERLRECGVPTRLIAAPRRNHGFDYVHLRQRRELFGEMLAFLEEHMGPPVQPAEDGS